MRRKACTQYLNVGLSSGVMLQHFAMSPYISSAQNCGRSNRTPEWSAERNDCDEVGARPGIKSI